MPEAVIKLENNKIPIITRCLLIYKIMLEKDFEELAAKTLSKISDALDQFDEAGDLEADYQNGIITITLDSGKQFIVNQHAPSRQIWLSSPLSGGKHFSYDTASGNWQLADGVVLNTLLSAELKTLADIDISI